MADCKSIMEICKDVGSVPFFVRREGWSEYSNYKVTRIEITDWPNGRAWGEFYGIFLNKLCVKPACEISRAHCSEWYLVEIDESKYDKNWYSQVMKAKNG